MKTKRLPKVNYPLNPTERKKLRKYWKPEKVKVLFVGEAPPENVEETGSYFYNHESEIKGLFKYITCSLNIEGDKKERLEKLRDDGFWLLDFFQNHIEELKDVEESELQTNITEFEGDFFQADPEYVVDVRPKRSDKSPLWKKEVGGESISSLRESFFERHKKAKKFHKVKKWSWDDFRETLNRFKTDINS